MLYHVIVCTELGYVIAYLPMCARNTLACLCDTGITSMGYSMLTYYLRVSCTH